MRNIFSLLVLMGLLASCTNKTTQCTDAPKNQWQEEAQFRASLEQQGYRINRLKITDGNCYEIYGFNSKDKKVEIYFNPVDGSKVKEEIEK